MKAIAFFNNKGGVGKTSLVYHLSWMFSELGYRVIAADLDPQANLTGMFLDEERLEQLWEEESAHTIEKDIAPLFDGTGDINEKPYIEKMKDNLGLLVGDLSLSKREEQLAIEWRKCNDGDARAFRVTTAFSRLIHSAGKLFHADLVLIDVGPDLGVINRAAFIASDHVVTPLAPDFFSLQGLKNVAPTLQDWRSCWQELVKKKPSDLDIVLATGDMRPSGYIILPHSVRLSQPAHAYNHCMEQVPPVYGESVIANALMDDSSADQFCLAHLKDYRSLMPLAQEARKPMFKLKPGDGAVGAQQSAVSSCYWEFQRLATKIAQICNIPDPAF